jgi:hypothetical protein
VQVSEAPRLVRRSDAISQLTERVVDTRLGRHWQVILPGVYATDMRPITDHDRLRAALLYAGPSAVLTDACALRVYGLPFVPDDEFARVLVPNEIQRSTRQFVVVRRTPLMPDALIVGDLRVAPIARALSDLALRNPHERSSLAAAAAAVQQGRTTVAALRREVDTAAARGRPRLRRVIGSLASGIRSAPEEDVRLLVARSRVLPTPVWNCLLRLPSGQLVSPDALFEDAGLVHEVNGRKYHAGEDVFEDMQRRHDAMVVGGLTLLHNSPRRVARESHVVLAEIEACYQREAGRGLPPGVEILRASPE